ncbi:MAG: DUF1553 domain-containing protein [Phycisphaera sp. RhM]|nr:DUF1553 domain-containing protein [Phycisphaera sp. RhM]
MIRTVLAGMIGVVTCVLLSHPPALRAETVPSVSERFAAAETDETPDFQQHVVPLLGRLGCNGRSCHGSFQGRGGLQLSLFGYDFQMDYRSLTAQASTAGDGQSDRRVDRRRPDESLVLQKPLLQVDHEGGDRFAEGSWEHHLLRRWIEDGAKPITQPRVLSHLEVQPAEVVFDSGAASVPMSPVPLRVVAVWEQGLREDVTPLCRFRTNDDSVVTVDSDGRLTSTGPGDSHVVVFYDNGVAAVPVLRPLNGAPDRARRVNDAETQPPSVDRFVLAKLDKLGINPSDVCSDAEFLRRLSIDVCGTLPTPQEVESFLADRSSDKRERKLDELLERPAYAAWWANKLCDFTGCNPNQQAELGQETSVQWYMWVYQRLRENVPYDELVRRIVLAKGREPGQSYQDYARQVSAYFRDDSPADFAERETMPHYWTRRSMEKPEDAAQAFAQNFLGLRLQCAQCHKHPFAPWTQGDFNEFSRFFENVEFGVDPTSLPQYRELAKQVGLTVRGDDGAAIRSDILRQAQKGRIVPWRELYIDARDEPESLSLLRSGSVTLQGNDDPREPIMSWMTDPANPWFAQAIVNRVWASYFHVGIIDPPDDLNPANPPSHPELLDWLTREFVRQNYDLKWLHHQIATSDTYQRSWKPNETNRDDRRNFSRAIPRRLPAEVVYDSIKQALVASDNLTEVRTDLTRRAIGHLSMRLAGTHAMQVFGKPDRAVNCDCERVNEPTLLQAVYLQNDPLVDQQLESSGWLQEIQAREDAGVALDPKRLIETAWLRTVSRPPTENEVARAERHLAASSSTTKAMRDLLWSLINTKEFILTK